MKNWLIEKLGGVSVSKYVGDIASITGSSKVVIDELDSEVANLKAEKAESDQLVNSFLNRFFFPDSGKFLNLRNRKTVMRFLPSSCFPDNQDVAFKGVPAHLRQVFIDNRVCNLKTIWDKFIHSSIPDLSIE